VTPPVAGLLTAVAVVGLSVTITQLAPTTSATRSRRRAWALVSTHRPAVTSGQWWVRLPAIGSLLARLERLWRTPAADRALPEMLQGIARELRAGASLTASVVTVAASIDPRPGRGDPEAHRLAEAVRRGVPFVAAVTEWAGPDPGPSRQLAATALIVAAETGGTTALVVDGVADTLRDRVALEREVGALSSQARASAGVLVVAPVVVAVLAGTADARIAGFLLGSPVGWACIVGGLTLDLIGAAWMRATIRRAT
jgi:tight adherence protein B